MITPWLFSGHYSHPCSLGLRAQHTCPCGFQEMANCQAVILSVEDETGHRIIIEDLLEATRSPEVGMRQAAAVILNIYCSRSKADYSSHLRSLVSGLMRLFNDTSPVVLEESWDALNAITKVRASDPRAVLWLASQSALLESSRVPTSVTKCQLCATVEASSPRCW